MMHHGFQDRTRERTRLVRTGLEISLLSSGVNVRDLEMLRHSQTVMQKASDHTVDCGSYLRIAHMSDDVTFSDNVTDFLARYEGSGTW